MIIPVYHVGSAILTYCAQNLGAKNYDRIKKGVCAGYAIGITYSAITLVFTFIFGKYLVGIFSDSPESTVVPLAVKMLLITVASYVPLTVISVNRLAIQGLGFPKVALCTCLFELIGRIIVALLLIPIFGFNGACLNHTSAWIFADIFLIPAYLLCMKKLKDRVNK